MTPFKSALAAFFLMFFLSGPVWAVSSDNPTDHRQYMTGPYTDGPSVTRDCIACHEAAAEEVLSSAHWLWEGPSPFVIGHEKDVHLGKRNLLNNF